MRSECEFGGSEHQRLNIASRPVANKYREGTVKRTLERELTVPEIAKEEACDFLVMSVKESVTFVVYLQWRRRVD